MNLLSQLFNTVLTDPILNILLAFYHTLGDFGLSIVALTLVAYLCLSPLLQRQFKRARALQALQPEMRKITQRFPNDIRARQQAQQSLLKEHGLSLLPSFWPMLLQMGLLSGLFLALNTVLSQVTVTSINQVLYPFLAHVVQMPDFNLTWFSVFHAGWIISLSLPDPTHILPIMTGIVTFLQMRMSQPLESREALLQAEQAMRWIGPVLAVAVTIFFAWRFAAGIALYRLIYLCLNSIHRLLVVGPGSLRLALPGSHPAMQQTLAGATTQQTPRRARPRHRHRRTPRRK